MFSWDELEAEERYLLEPAEELLPERVYDRHLAFTVLEHAASRLLQEYELAGKRRLYDFLRTPRVFVLRAPPQTLEWPWTLATGTTGRNFSADFP